MNTSYFQLTTASFEVGKQPSDNKKQLVEGEEKLSHHRLTEQSGDTAASFQHIFNVETDALKTAIRLVPASDAAEKDADPSMTPADGDPEATDTVSSAAVPQFSAQQSIDRKTPAAVHVAVTTGRGATEGVPGPETGTPANEPTLSGIARQNQATVFGKPVPGDKPADLALKTKLGQAKQPLSPAAGTLREAHEIQPKPAPSDPVTRMTMPVLDRSQAALPIAQREFETQQSSSAASVKFPIHPLQMPNVNAQLPRADPMQRSNRPALAAWVSGEHVPPTPTISTRATASRPAPLNTGIPQSTLTQQYRLVSATSDFSAFSAVEPDASPMASHATDPVRATLPVHVARQMIEVVQHLPSRPVEITLRPEELGRVRLSVTPSEHGITVNILAERADTLDLMRRHIDQLAQEFQSLGYEDIGFSFAQSGNDTSDKDSDGTTDNTSQNAKPGIEHDDAGRAHIHLTGGPVTGLDLRL